MKYASYLAIKCLYTLGVECEYSNEKIAKIIKLDFYVDDLLTGFESREEATEACKEISEVLSAGGFPIRKFYSNDSKVLKYIEHNSSFAQTIEFGENEKAKTLGLSWAPHSDTLLYNISSFITQSLRISQSHVVSNVKSSIIKNKTAQTN
ncbi:hypothetical protein JTB14_003893 [Gonioctena quinquepunctata]|nr:hypothetical protein JTB14_003893 [Gonioctena quinquepunctata]